MTAETIALEERVSNVSATAFITLYARAMESQSTQPILHDPYAVQIAECLRPTLARSDRTLCRELAAGHLEPMVVVSMALRARRIDRYARDFLARRPDGAIVNLGCGLDTRFHRLEDLRAIVFDLDLPEMIELKRTLLDEGPRYHYLTSSVLDFSWMDQLPAPGSTPFLFIAEGLFMYLPADQVKALVIELRRRFPGSELVCEVFNSFWLREPWRGLVDRKLQRRMHFSPDAAFQSGIADSRAFESWDKEVRFLDDWSYFDDGEPKLGGMNWMQYVPFLRKTQWTVHYRLG